MERFVEWIRSFCADVQLFLALRHNLRDHHFLLFNRFRAKFRERWQAEWCNDDKDPVSLRQRAMVRVKTYGYGRLRGAVLSSRQQSEQYGDL